MGALNGVLMLIVTALLVRLPFLLLAADQTILSQSCARPAAWCSHAGSKFTAFDCDGDRVLDLTCTDVWGQRWVILSRQGCTPQGPQAPASTCPVIFHRECLCCGARSGAEGQP